MIRINNLQKNFGTKKAVDIENYTIGQGDMLGLVGNNGAGKTTLLNILGGMDSCDEGNVWLDGRNVSRFSARELPPYRRYDVGFVFQFYNLIPDLTVKENIQVVSDIADKPLDIDEVMQALDIDKYKDRFSNELSGGQQQRVAIARALIKNPKLLLCDELTGALDSKTSRTVLKFIEKVNQQFGTTIAIITHNEAIAGMADAVIKIKDGKVSSNTANENKLPASELAL